MTHQTIEHPARPMTIVEAFSESAPFTREFFWVQGAGFRCMAYQDQAGKWYEAFCHWALSGPIQILE